MLLLNGRIHLLDRTMRVVEALAIEGGRVVAAGTTADLRRAFPPQREIDLQGAFVYPGFIDAHGHLHRYARSLGECDLRGATSFEAVVARLQAFAQQQPAGWLVGRGWDQHGWPGEQMPDRRLLDQAFPDRPVWLERVDLHASVANGRALELAGITADTRVAGGEVVCRGGQPTGLLIDRAQERVSQVVPEPSETQWRGWLGQACNRLLAHGLTCVGDALLSHEEATRLLALQAAGDFPLRVFGMLPGDAAHFAHYLPLGPQQHAYLHLTAFKWFADGALGSHGAWLLEDYAGHPGERGLPLLPETAEAQARAIYAAGFQLCVHAIGDAANRAVLDLFRRVLPPGNDRRWRVEHAQVLHPADREAFRSHGIVPSIQPTHATSDRDWAGRLLGPERLAYAYPLASLCELSGRVALGTDFPVEPPDPLRTFLAAVWRRQPGQDGAFLPGEALSRQAALQGMTRWAAWAQGMEAEIGSLRPGHQADWVALDQDLLRASLEDLVQARVLQTGIGGKVVFSA